MEVDVTLKRAYRMRWPGDDGSWRVVSMSDNCVAETDCAGCQRAIHIELADEEPKILAAIAKYHREMPQ